MKLINTEIQVGKFGRTNLGKILIFAYIENAQGERYKNKVILSDGKKIINDFYYFEKGEKIVKESSNIIDLIEVGDYVNGLKVYDIEKGENIVTKKDCIAINKQNLGATILYEKSIKSIVTKENFKSMEYEVEQID